MNKEQSKAIDDCILEQTNDDGFYLCVVFEPSDIAHPTVVTNLPPEDIKSALVFISRHILANHVMAGDGSQEGLAETVIKSEPMQAKEYRNRSNQRRSDA